MSATANRVLAAWTLVCCACVPSRGSVDSTQVATPLDVGRPLVDVGVIENPDLSRVVLDATSVADTSDFEYPPNGVRGPGAHRRLDDKDGRRREGRAFFTAVAN